MAKIEAGVAVLVIGPTIANSPHLVGRCGIVQCWVNEGDPTERFMVAAGDGWRVEFDRPTLASHYFAIFHASSLLPLDTDAEDESESTPSNIPCEVA